MMGLLSLQAVQQATPIATLEVKDAKTVDMQSRRPSDLSPPLWGTVYLSLCGDGSGGTALNTTDAPKTPEP